MLNRAPLALEFALKLSCDLGALRPIPVMHGHGYSRYQPTTDSYRADVPRDHHAVGRFDPATKQERVADSSGVELVRALAGLHPSCAEPTHQVSRDVR